VQFRWAETFGDPAGEGAATFVPAGEEPEAYEDWPGDDWPEVGEPDFWISGALLDPPLRDARMPIPGAWVRDGQLDGLLEAIVVYEMRPDASEAALTLTSGVTVRTLIVHLANALGGVHHGAQRDDPPELLTMAIEEAMPQVLWTVRALG
jgi:hypothetical protein